MKTIAICNLKGGVAKTVSCVNIAAILAHDHGKRVLVIDADAQANATEFLGGDPLEGRLSAMLRYPTAKTALPAVQYACASVQPTSLKNVSLIAADDTLMDLDLSSLHSEDVEVTIIRDFLRDENTRKAFDYVLIDCPPAFNAASAAALLAADEVMVPIKLDAFSIRGMGNLMRQISNMRQINPRLRVGGILPTMWYASEAITKAERTLREHGLPVYPHIRRSPRVDDMTFAQEPLISCSPLSGACRDYRRLCRLLVEGGAVNG